jgi:uncharacterized protein YjiK
MINVVKNKNIPVKNFLLAIWKWLPLFFSLLLLLSACKRKVIVLKSPPGYNFQVHESKKLELKLREISGIVWDKKRNLFIAQDDESGNIYFLDKEYKNVSAVFTFGEKGDYEDIALLDSIPYILRSDGTIFKYHIDPSNTVPGIEIGKLELPGKNDFESLYYDPDRKALIMICKNCAMDNGKTISAFAWYPESGGFDPRPVYQIDVAAIQKLSPQKAGRFQPSAAAIHPRQRKLYILSAASRQLAITDMNGTPESVFILAPKMFPQPEGICFKNDGTMYISNEGGSGRATLLRFTYTDTGEEPGRSKTTAPAGNHQPYDFSRPDDKMELRKHLHEISGMAWINEKNVILAQNDEKGDIYMVDFYNKKDDFKKIKFGGKGDYEDIVHTDTADYLLLSSGTIVQVMINDSVVTGTKEFTLDKKGKNEFESLYLDAAAHSLVMLCKQCAKEKENSRAAFRFDLQTQKFQPEPLFTIQVDSIRKKLNDDTVKFKPSAAALHPVTGELYIVASVGKLLVVADPSGQVKQVFRLDPLLFNQPEGIAFAPNGDLYISNEGGEGVATILKFSYKL